jgi:glycine/D-amino acid oxidase-like deaminating enzyme
VPDVIVIGGGIIGATTAWQLAERGAEVLLLERGHLASGATRRSQGLLLEPEVDPMQPLFAESNRLYDHLAERAGLDLALDREPIGTLFLATSEAQLERLAENVPAQGRLLDRDAVLEAEPGLAPTVSGGLLLPGGRRTDPAALTAAAAEMARQAGAEIRCHVDVKRVSPGAAVTDGGFERAGTVVLTAGAWSRRLAHTAGHELLIRPVRGWLAVTAPVPPLLRHIVYEAGYALARGPQPGEPVLMSDLADGDVAVFGTRSATAMTAHQNADGSIMVGATRAPALREGDESAGALRDTAARVCQLLPAMASIEVETTWSGLRPFTPDELPYIGHLEEGLAVCAGHSSDGILAGAGSGRLVAEMVLATEPFTDPAPFSPSRSHADGD